MIDLHLVYDLAGLVFAVVAVGCALQRGAPRRASAAAFWGLIAVSFLFGDRLGDLGNGWLVLGLALFGGVFGLGPAPAAETVEGEAAARLSRLKGWLFAPLLVIPVVTLAGSLALPALRLHGQPLASPKDAAILAMAAGVVLALILAMVLTRAPPLAPARAATRLMQSVGQAAILPQLLAALGAVFVLAKVGTAVETLISRAIPLDTPLTAVIAFCLGMAVFTMAVGNAFAAFPILVSGIGAPILVGRFGGDPAAMGAIGMLSGFCGTLMTPMAAHNIVPTALLELPPWAVIRVQLPTALILLAINIALCDLLVFHPIPI
ncbi:MAG: DUF979 domain-containing protein [Alphaproteobacteria bacterium]|nr:DUF979 domain-containing protein [Alphaproteobacteria bacterium]